MNAPVSYLGQTFQSFPGVLRLLAADPASWLLLQQLSDYADHTFFDSCHCLPEYIQDLSCLGESGSCLFPRCSQCWQESLEFTGLGIVTSAIVEETEESVKECILRALQDVSAKEVGKVLLRPRRAGS